MSAHFVPTPLDRDAPLYVAGHRGLVGSAIWRQLQGSGFSNLIGRTSAELDLKNRGAVFAFFEEQKPKAVVLAAAKVGGILANSTYPVDFLSENLQIQVNVLDAALAQGVQRVLFLGSSCIYPKLAPQPIKEEYLLTGPLGTNKRRLCNREDRRHSPNTSCAQAIRVAMDLGRCPPTSTARATISRHRGRMYFRRSSVRYDEARRDGIGTVTNWGSGSPRREFLHVDDMAAACVHLLEHYDGPDQVNVGTGEDSTIKEIAEIVADAVGFTGVIEWDTTKPDGTPQKLLDVNKLRGSGWEAKIGLRAGIASTVEWYRANAGSLADIGIRVW